MYTQFFGFQEKPFNVTPDPKFLYLSASHKEALAAMLYGIRERKGFVAIIGEVGTGKTTLLRSLLQELEESTSTILVFNTKITFIELLHYIFWELDIRPNAMSKQELIQALNQYLIAQLASGGNVALIIDEAQNLSSQVLEELRMLSNLETDTQKLIQIVLVGQPELNTQLNSPALRQLKQRIGIRCYLTQLSDKESREYITHRLAVAGCKNADLFSKTAVEHICSHARGIPRIINTLCDNALLTAYSRNLAKITPAIVDEVIADLQQSELSQQNKKHRTHRVAPGHGRSAPMLRPSPPIIFSLLAAGLLIVGIFLYGNPFTLDWWPALISPELAVKQQASDTPPGDIEDQPRTAHPPPSLTAAEFHEEYGDEKTGNHQMPNADTKDDTHAGPASEVTDVNEAEDEPMTVPVQEGDTRRPTFLTARENDTVSNMAVRHYGVFNEAILDRIKRANPDIADLNLIQIGQTIVFPALAVDNSIMELEEGIYSVHMASFGSYEQATRFLDTLSEENYPIVISSTGAAGEQPRYRVTMGSFSSRAQAVKAAQGMVNPVQSNSALTGQVTTLTTERAVALAE